ncbi:MAG: lectin like domain-containing protein [Elusimicrobia bacterium]|nr:lectin like domain-containing protein [Elusimicrobiota bacterium]
MKISNKIFLSLVLAVFCAGNVFAQTKQKFQLSPVNPEFTKYLELKTAGKWPTKTPSGRALGYTPSPVSRAHILGKTTALQHIKYSASFDLRLSGRITAVRNQGGCYSCWAFATYGSLESMLAPSEVRNFSESNLNNLSGFDYGYCNGGDYYMSTAYLTRLAGPINESDDAYTLPMPPSTSPSGLAPQKHVQEVLFLPNRDPLSLPGDPAFIDSIKWALTNYGAVAVSFYVDELLFNTTYKSYYYTGSNGPNHGVTIVGWDDNFDKTHFTPNAPDNGAFIVKNSWGTSWAGGAGGYFYLSYYDAQLQDVTVFNSAAPTTNYQHVYQYDPLGRTTDIYYVGPLMPDVWGANIFTSVAYETLSAVGFYISDQNSNYEISVYTDVASGSPSSGRLASTKTGYSATPGYHTVALSSPVQLSAGQKFSAVVKITSSISGKLAVEMPIGGYSSPVASLGQSYISIDGSDWDDLAGFFTNTNACIKAYTSRVTAVTEIKEAKAYPSPVWFSRGKKLTFGNIAANKGDVTIFIHSVTGGLVKKLQGADIVYDPLKGSNSAIWDGKNSDGQKVASGVYIYTIKTAAGDSITDKVGVFW